jgi:hypothetical protein
MKTTLTLAVTVLLGSQMIPTNVAAQVSARSETRVEVRGQSGSSAVQPQEQNTQPRSAEAVIRATAEAGLPEAPVRRTVAGGEAKGAGEAEVTRAALRTQGRLMVARDALESEGEREPSQKEITLGAEFLARGGSSADLERVADAAPEGRSLEASLQTMLSLGGSGGSTSGEISSRIAAQLQAGASDRSLAALAGIDLSAALSGSGGVVGGASATSSVSGSAAAAASGASAAAGAVQVGGGLAGSLGVRVP